VGKAQALLSMGAEADGKDPVSGWTALHHACGLGLKLVVRFLLTEAKADSAVMDNDGTYHRVYCGYSMGSEYSEYSEYSVCSVYSEYSVYSVGCRF
jgi:hypothetical protein